MIHIVWSGKGYLVAVLTFGSSLLGNLITNAATGDRSYWDGHRWPFATCLCVASVACWLVGLHLHGKGARLLIDPQTGEEVILRNSHTLFFIPVVWWGPILAVWGAIELAVDLAGRR